MAVAIATLSSVPPLAAATVGSPDNDHEKRPSFAMSTRSVDSSSSSSAAERGEARRRGFCCYSMALLSFF
jgi:hypothetical protein